MQFSVNIGQIVSWHLHLRVDAPSWKFWIHHCSHCISDSHTKDDVGVSMARKPDIAKMYYCTRVDIKKYLNGIKTRHITFFKTALNNTFRQVNCNVCYIEGTYNLATSESIKKSAVANAYLCTTSYLQDNAS